MRQHFEEEKKEEQMLSVHSVASTQSMDEVEKARQYLEK